MEEYDNIKEHGLLQIMYNQGVHRQWETTNQKKKRRRRGKEMYHEEWRLCMTSTRHQHSQNMESIKINVVTRTSVMIIGLSIIKKPSVEHQ